MDRLFLFLVLLAFAYGLLYFVIKYAIKNAFSELDFDIGKDLKCSLREVITEAIEDSKKQ